MKITFDIPDSVAARVVAALGQDRREGETPAQAAKRNVVDYIKRQVALYEGDAARNAAIEKAREEVTVT